LILLASLLVPRLFQLDQFVAVDEVNWLHRSANFYSAFMSGEYSGTFVNRTPGVITTWIESAAFRIEMPYYGISKEAQRTHYAIFELSLTELDRHPMEILYVARVLMVLFLAGVLMSGFYYAVRLFGLVPAFIGFLLIAVDPFLTALSRISHLDAPQATLMVLSLLAFSSFLFVEDRIFDLIVSGAAGGMALLAKLPGVFILPVIFLLAGVQLWQTQRGGQKISFHEVRRSISSLVIWGLVFGLVFFALWPAMWVQPIDTISKVFIQALRYSSTAAETVGLGQISIPDDSDTFGGLSITEPDYSLAYFLRYPIFFLWRVTPIVLLGILLFIFFSLRIKPVNHRWTRGLAGIWILILIYTIGMTLPWKSSDKYYAPVFLLACLVAGIGWYSLYVFLGQKTRKNHYGAALLGIVFVGQLLMSLNHFPYYFTYFDPLMGGTAGASQTRTIGVGEGLDIAGRYLNAIPDSDELRVMSWYGIGPFSYFFDGQVKAVYDVTEELWTPEFVETLEHMDYLVIYTNQKFRHRPSRLFELLEDVTPIYTVNLHGAEYAWIYKTRDIALDHESWD